MRIQYEDWKPGSEAAGMVRHAQAICIEYEQRGYDLTLRQLYYQFVARDLLANTQRNYNRLGEIVNRARLAGLLDWDHIVDRTRNLQKLPHWNDPSGVVESAAKSFGVDLWDTQPTRVEVWVEKEALAGVIAQAANAYDCAWFSCRGYVSQSEMWGAGQRLGRYIEGGQNVVILHLGDHDPSGMDMTRDIRERIDTFLTQDYLNAHLDEFEESKVRVSEIRTKMAERCGVNYDDVRKAGAGGAFEVRRIALNDDQIAEYNPPPNPAKLSDSRSADYVEKYGTQSWELDALDPGVLVALIQDEVATTMDVEKYEARRDEQERHRDLLNTASRRWIDIVEFLESEAS